MWEYRMYEGCSVYKRNVQSFPDVPYEMHQVDRTEGIIYF